MGLRNLLLAVILIAFSSLSLAESTVAPVPQPDPQALIGKAPPPIKVAKWVKGEPLNGFEKGKVYVVDFWATWCGPCKAAIPHLTKLAKEHKGQLEIVGVSISEPQKDTSDTSYIEKVQHFVDKMGDRMDYRVAVDTPDKVMHDTWFKPTGTDGIPTAYIIDQNGLVAWTGIGSPSDVERIVGQVLAGTFDYKKEQERARQLDAEAKKRSEADIAVSKANAKKIDEKYPGFQEAMDRGDTAAALESINAAFKADPTLEPSGGYQRKFYLLLQRGKADAVNAYSKELMEHYPNNRDVFDWVSACTVQTSTDEPKFDKNLAFLAAKRSADSAKPDSRWQQFARWRLGWAYYQMGDKQKAIEWMQSALDGVNKLKGKYDFTDLDSECEDAIKEIQQLH
ncbi:MAG: redoxin domain-containing protein [Tepidisphaeraceae bacterium]|jgi:thiol-disulfide isomerase/thioredoxin